MVALDGLVLEAVYLSIINSDHNYYTFKGECEIQTRRIIIIYFATWKSYVKEKIQYV